MSRQFSLDRIRNIGIIAHIDAGKTTFSERVLFYTGKKHKIGEVHDGGATMDWMDQEQERGITITSAATTCLWKDHQINLIDTPGHIDFTVEVKRSLRVLDGAVVVFDGVAGVEPQSETNWRYADDFRVPRFCFINKLDRTGADFYADLKSIHTRLTPNAYAMQLPIGTEANFVGIVDLLTRRAEIYRDDMGKDIEETDCPEDLKPKMEEYRARLIEAIVENDEAMMEKYLAGEEPSLQDLKRALRKAVINLNVIPVFCGTALKNKGIQFVLDAVVDYLPSPLDVPAVKGIDPRDDEKVLERDPSDDEPFAALAFKIYADPFVGKLCFFRVYSGVLKAGSYIVNTTTGNKERIGRILRMHANSREEIEEVRTGDIAAAVGLKNTFTGDSLCEEDHQITLEKMTFPEPVIHLAVEPKTKADQEKLAVALQKLAEEDPTFTVRTDEETTQTIIGGMGELHLDVIVERLRREFSVECNTGSPQVAYRETITRSAEAEGKYVKQSGGRGQYGHCWIRVERIPEEERAEKGNFAFLDEIKGGVIPREYIPAIGKGIKEAMATGVVAGYPMIGIQAAVYDGTYHDVDSSEVAFKIAGSMGFKDACRKAGPVLLEPIMKVEVIVPEDFMGDCIGDLSSKRGQIKEMRDRTNGIKAIEASVPLSEMFGYATQLRSMTQGRGSYTMEFNSYEPVPKNVEEAIKAGKK